jgi:uncharacterized protein (TIGR00106 family)
MSVLMEFAMFPTDKGESVSADVSRIIEMVRDSGVDYRLTPMGTIIETRTLEEALGIVQRAHDVLAPDAGRIYATVKLDIRKGRDGRMEGKIRSVQEHVGAVRT